MSPFDPTDVAALHARQRAAVAAGPRWGAKDRKARLRALEGSLRRHVPALRAALHADLRKHRDEVDVTELNPCFAELRHAWRSLEKWMRPQPVRTPALLFAARSEIRREPKGHVLILAPWNYPVFLTIPPLVAAVAAGNRAIIRPSEKAPHTARVLAGVVASAFPADEVALVEGDVAAAEFLLTLPFDHIFFTGSGRTGRHVMHAAAEQSCSVTLELGGKSPAIVDESADLRAAARRIVWGKFINAGQTCVAPDYVLVHRRVEAALLRELKEALARAYGRSEDERRRSPDFCRLVDDASFDRLAGVLDATVAGGAQVEAGGGRERGSRYLAPTILRNVRADAPIMDAEIFGPILPVLCADDLDAATAAVNARPKPLALYFFSRRRGSIERILERTSAGGTVVNDTVVHLANPYLPFGGVGPSGIGAYHGEFGFRTFSHERAVVVRRPVTLGALLYPPYGARTRAVTSFVRRFLS